MTGDVNERISISTYRFVAVDHHDFYRPRIHLATRCKIWPRECREGWSITIGIFAAVNGNSFFSLSFLTVKERVQPDPAQEKFAQAGFKRRPPQQILGGAVFRDVDDVYHAKLVRGGSMTFYMNEYVNREAMFTFSQRPQSGGASQRDLVNGTIGAEYFRPFDRAGSLECAERRLRASRHDGDSFHDRRRHTLEAAI